MEEYVIDYFYSKEFGTWVVILMDEEENQVADAIYRAYKLEAKKVTKDDFEIYHWLKEE